MSRKKTKVSVNYTSKDFQSIREDLIRLAERFYPDSFLDFSENSLGAMMIDSVAYVGDQLSFYVDYNVNESFLDTAVQPSNIARQAAILGYREPSQQSTYGVVAVYILVPATTSGMGPDKNYLPILKRGTRFSADSGQQFVLYENVDFSDPSNLIVVGNVNDSGTPTQYAVRAFGKVVSGFFNQGALTVGAFERFKRVTIRQSNIAEIISVIDAEGNEYFEVENLSQDIVFKEIANSNYKNDNVPSILKPMIVNRKFVVEYGTDRSFLQFGSGDVEVDAEIAEPENVAFDIYGKTYVSSFSFDPTALGKNSSTGVVPQNTTLFITYRINNSLNSNVATGALNKVSSIEFSFNDETVLIPSKVEQLRVSVEVENEEPIIGSSTTTGAEQVKRRALDSYASQNRAVTQRDYESLVYRMPNKFGSIKRCSAQKDPDSQKRNLNLYVLAEDSFGYFTEANTTLKNNLKTWINHYRMMNDTVDILDGLIVNFGIDFVVKASPGVEKNALLDRCVEAVASQFSTKSFIGEHLSISSLFSALNGVQGVQDAVKIKLRPKTGSNYSNVTFSFDDNYSPDGDELIVPKNVVMELKYTSSDIRGKIR
jgi:hypothetical protein